MVPKVSSTLCFNPLPEDYLRETPYSLILAERGFKSHFSRTRRWSFLYSVPDPCHLLTPLAICAARTPPEFVTTSGSRLVN